MGRRKGGHNTRGIKQGYGEGVRIHLAKVFEKELLRELEDLVSKSKISLREVANDALAEGMTCLRVDGYKSLIEFRKRRGKLIHERELEALSGGSEGPTPEERGAQPTELLESLPAPEPAPEPDTFRPPPFVEQRGLSPENQPSALVSDPEMESIDREIISDMMSAVSDDPPL